MEIKTIIEIFTGRKVIRIDFVNTNRGGRYMFAHLDGEMIQHAFNSLMYSQHTFAVGHGYIRIGLNRSGGVNLSTDDEISQVIFNPDETIHRDLHTGVHHRYDVEAGTWIVFVPEIQEVTMEDDFTPPDTIIEIEPEAPKKNTTTKTKTKRKQMRMFKTDEERNLARALFV
jgi:hypothetical protein